MTYLKFIRQYRSPANMSNRFLEILKRYNFDEAAFQTGVKNFIQDCNQHNIIPTLPVTAQVAKKYHQFFQNLNELQSEIACHGEQMQDYTLLSDQQKKDSLIEAFMIFQETGIPLHGIRFPYLRADEVSLNFVADLQLDYDNSLPFWWAVDEWDKGRHHYIVEKMRRQYNALLPDQHFVIPRFRNGIIQIPASLPDDDLLWDRALVRKDDQILAIWKQVLDGTMKQGGLFSLILHPER
ncbi:MAG: hypothetical protein WAN36_12835, partial [Calditrichia bacterium]